MLCCTLQARICKVETANGAATAPNVCTSEYASPERLQEFQHRSPQDDVYSFGMVMYFIVTGKPPFSSMDHCTAPPALPGWCLCRFLPHSSAISLPQPSNLPTACCALVFWTCAL
jgi:serine/threonine protein kinase